MSYKCRILLVYLARLIPLPSSGLRDVFLLALKEKSFYSRELKSQFKNSTLLLSIAVIH